jgi:Fe2+ transport system protein FeoA
MTLSTLRRGGSARIAALPVGDIRAQFIRMGLSEGAVVRCLERLPGGTLVIALSRQELALSAELAAHITIAPL